MDSWSNKQNQNNQSVNSTSIAFSPQGNLVTSGNQLVLTDFTVTGNVVGTAPQKARPSTSFALVTRFSP